MSMRTRPFGERGVTTRRWRGVRAALLVPGLFLCAQARANPPEARMQITSSSFTHQGAIPAKYTCEGPDTSPPLAWSGVPPSAKSLALIVDDPDAPDPKAPKMTWVHWVLYDVPSGTSSLAEGASRSLPSGTRDGLNDWRRTGYGGPCPPIGRHRYFFKLYALDIVLPDLSKPSKAELLKAIEGHVVGTAELVGTYQKGQK
jgi:Raf kinase inhibitor-like YbhB/YbcL family protein